MSTAPSFEVVRVAPTGAWLGRLTTYPKTILIAALALTAVGVWGVLGVTFDHNVLKLSTGVEIVRGGRRIGRLRP